MVKRYDWDAWDDGGSIAGGMFKEEDGGWVSYDDYAALQAENERLTEELRKVNAGETVSVRFDLSPAAKEGAVRNQLVAMGWTPPGHLETIDLEQIHALAAQPGGGMMVRRIEYVGGSYPMEEREDGDYVEYDDYSAMERRLTSIISGLELDLKKAQELVARYRCMQDLWLSDD